jgi:putative chitinase
MNSFTFDFTLEKTQRCLGRNSNVPALFIVFQKILPKYNITSSIRVAAFFAQCGHESLDFTVLKENLNYGAKGLRATFPKYFPTDELAIKYERKPELIANRVYANRMLNGDEASGDGWKFRGRGAIQITGKENYTKLSLFLNKTIDETIQYCETLDGAIESACWFWNTRDLNTLADKSDILQLTKKINGGTIGLPDRIMHFEFNKKTL